jgi:hypothetical protein
VDATSFMFALAILGKAEGGVRLAGSYCFLYCVTKMMDPQQWPFITLVAATA